MINVLDEYGGIYIMKKLYLLLIAGFVSSCAVNNKVPIRSVNKPRPMNKPDNSVVIAPVDNDDMEKMEKAEEINQNKISMVDEVNNTTSVVDTKDANIVKNEDVKETNFGAKGYYKIGNPYLIDGVSYFPHEDYNYSEIGMASWYGPNFNGKSTSNGEILDADKITAAHRTLPMPSLVRVTNLENGVSLNVKINDRGPYARDRIIDLSSKTAEILGIKQKGSARVKVEILPEQSKILKELAINSQNTNIYPADISRTNVSQSELLKRPIEEKESFTNMPTPIVDEKPVEEKVAEKEAYGDFFVQIAAYSTYDKAEEMKRKIQSIAPVKIFKAVVNGNTLYKVRLGEFNTETKANAAKNQVESMGISGSRIIKRNNGGFSWM